MKKTMPPTFHRILATTALCLAAVGQSSCVSRLHRVAYEYPRTYEGAGLEDNSVSNGTNAINNCTFYCSINHNRTCRTDNCSRRNISMNNNISTEINITCFRCYFH